MPLPLDGIKVLDLSRLLPGPYCSLMLADLGADVIKVEDPNGGDYTRWAPPNLGEYSSLFMMINRNKRSICLNLKDERAKEILLKLVDEADVLLETFRPGVMERLGLDYEKVLKPRNKRLVYCAISGYGQDGPYRLRAGHDNDYLAISGMLNVVGRKDSIPGLLPTQVGDLAGGSLFGAVGILAALMARERSGEGQLVDTSMTDGATAMLVFLQSMWAGNGFVEPKQGDERLTGELACYEVYQTSDGRALAMGALEPKFWAAFCNHVGKPDWVGRQFDYGERKNALYAEVQELFAAKTSDEWRAELAGTDFCCEVANTFEQALEDPQLKHRGMFFHIDDGEHEPLFQVRTPFFLSESPEPPRRYPPRMGEHTAEVLATVGVSDVDLDTLVKDGVTKLG